MPAGGRLTKPFSVRIVVGAVLGVMLVGVLIMVGVYVSRPTIRLAMLRHMVAAMDVSACTDDPAGWGWHQGEMRVYAYDPAGRSSNPDAPLMEPALLERALGTGRGVVMDSDDKRSVSVLPVEGSGACAVLRVESPSPDGGPLRDFLVVLWTTVLGGAVAAAVGMFLFVVWPLRKRIAALSTAASGVGRQHFSLPEQRDGALGHIAEVLSASHARIVDSQHALERRNQALEQHLLEIAHDLRTPLASMQLSLEALVSDGDGLDTAESRRALSDVVYLSALVENLHHGTRLRQDVEVQTGPIDLQELVRRLEHRFAIVGRHAGVEINASVPDGPVWVECAPTLAERAFANLLQNGVEHNEAGGHVAVILVVDQERFELTVVDDGPGLPSEMLATLASETFTSDEARRRGPGLGMLITREVATRAGWGLVYESMEPTGLRVRVSGPTVPGPDY